MNMTKDFLLGWHSLFKGARALFLPKVRRYVVIPFLINLLIFGGLFYYCAVFIWQKLQILSFHLPSWLHWLEGIVFVVKIFLLSTAFLLLLSSFAFLLTLMANILAAPFNGLLSEAYLQVLGAQLPQRPFLEMLRVTLGRELIKLLYYLPRTLGVYGIAFILYFIPPFNVLIGALLFLFSAWMIAIQYLDYPAENYHMPFKQVLSQIRTRRWFYLGFGTAVLTISSIPILNLLIMPAAVLGASAIAHSQTDPHSPY